MHKEEKCSIDAAKIHRSIKERLKFMNVRCFQIHEKLRRGVFLLAGHIERGWALGRGWQRHILLFSFPHILVFESTEYITYIINTFSLKML